jgi:hypothetical protein|tara:strand:+ start:2516 stop:3835 length:1320 start_codon:yes stop_codon:yes gene_type:complete
MTANFNAEKGNITKFTIKAANSGRFAEIQPIVFSYYENIFSPTIKVTANVMEAAPEAQNTLLDGLPIRSGEEIEISFEDNHASRGGENNVITLDNLRVDSIFNVITKPASVVYSMNIKSREFFWNDNSICPKTYKGKISDIVRSIWTDPGDGKIYNGLGSSLDRISIEPTKNYITKQGMNFKPLYLITSLAADSIPENTEDGKTAGFLFFQTQDGYQFKSLDTLFSEKKNYKRYIYNNTNKTPVGYDGNILKYNINRNVNLSEKLRSGAWSTKSYYFDTTTFNFQPQNYNIADVKEDLNLAADQMFYPEEFVGTSETPIPSRRYMSILDNGNLTTLDEFSEDRSRPNLDLRQLQSQSVARMNQLTSTAVSITIKGDFSLRAGDTIYCDFPQYVDQMSEEVNTQTGGIYMISALCHRLSSDSCYTSLDLVRDSFGRQPYN